LADRAVTRRLDALWNRKRRNCSWRLTQHQELCCNRNICLGSKYILGLQFPGWGFGSCLHITTNLQRLELFSVFPPSMAYLEFSFLAEWRPDPVDRVPCYSFCGASVSVANTNSMRCDTSFQSPF
jgi:hypothetical protein